MFKMNDKSPRCFCWKSHVQVSLTKNVEREKKTTKKQADRDEFINESRKNMEDVGKTMAHVRRQTQIRWVEPSEVDRAQRSDGSVTSAVTRA